MMRKMMVCTLRDNNGNLFDGMVTPMTDVIKSLYDYEAGAAVVMLEATGSIKDFPILNGRATITVEPSSRME